MISIVNKCTNLKFLSIRGMTRLDATSLCWTPASSGLEVVHLNRLRITADALVRLLSPRKGHSSALKLVELGVVKLTEGLWSDVFDHLTNYAAELVVYTQRLPDYEHQAFEQDIFLGVRPEISSYRRIEDVKAQYRLVRIVAQRQKRSQFWNKMVQEEVDWMWNYFGAYLQGEPEEEPQNETLG
jgi:hypothetical protein